MEASEVHKAGNKASKRRSNIRIKDRKLGREKAYGQALHGPSPTIEIDPRLKSRKRLEIVIHEALHHLAHEWSEGQVTDKARKLACVLWTDFWRRVEK